MHVKIFKMNNFSTCESKIENWLQSQAGLKIEECLIIPASLHDSSYIPILAVFYK